MSAQELERILGLIKANPPTGTTVAEGRAAFDKASDALPLAADISYEDDKVGGVPAIWTVPPTATAGQTVLYLHGGAYALGNAKGYRTLTGELGRHATARVVAIDYRLAPEHPFPAAVDDAVAAYRDLLGRGISPTSLAVAGDSAGGGLVVAMLVAARDAGLPMPAACLAISPWCDLTCDADSLTRLATRDLLLTRERLKSRVEIYLGTRDKRDPLASPVFANLKGLPPLLIQVGTGEILLDEGVALAKRAAECDVRVTLDVWPDMPHVWHRLAPMLGEGRAAIEQGGRFIAGKFR